MTFPRFNHRINIKQKSDKNMNNNGIEKLYLEYLLGF